MTRYKIIYDKEVCIGSKNCEATSPEFWKVINNKSNLKGAVFNKTTGKYELELELDESELEIQKKVVKSCPVNCISIEKV